MKDVWIFWVVKKQQGFFWVLYSSSAQVNNNISPIYCWCGIFWGILKNVGILLAKQFLILVFLGIKYDSLSDPPVIKISE